MHHRTRIDFSVLDSFVVAPSVGGLLTSVDTANRMTTDAELAARAASDDEIRCKCITWRFVSIPAGFS